MARAPRRADLAARLKARLPALRSEVGRSDALIEALREANATTDPRDVANWLVAKGRGWIPAPAWGVVVLDSAGLPAVLSDEGLTPSLKASLLSVSEWVLRHGVEFVSADLAADSRVTQGARGTAMAFPLNSRQQTVGVLVGLDGEPSGGEPAVGRRVAVKLRELLQAAAIGLDNALTLQRLEALSVTDDLTLLFNSRFLNQALGREAKRSRRNGRPLSLLFMDLDGFKTVNDTHGHLAGSKALVEAGRVIASCARETDVVARFGGDEFAVILPDTDQEGAVAVAQRTCARIRETPFLASEGLALRLSISIGVATLPDAAGSAEELLRAADTAMYRVKASGKDGITIAEGAPAS